MPPASERSQAHILDSAASGIVRWSVCSTPLSKNINTLQHIMINVLVVLYDSEIWSRTLREEHKLIPFDKRIQRKIFGPK
jgi:hypothetical protein